MTSSTRFRSLSWKKFSFVFLGLSFSVTSFSAPLFGKSLNAGMSLGKLYYVKNVSEYATLKWDASMIYVLPSTPPDISPIAGVLSRSPGSTVSHVQLLCKSLGVPNGALSDAEYASLASLHGKEVFYAAYDFKPLILKEASQMTEKEKLLFASYTKEAEISPVVLPDVDAQASALKSLNEISKSDSGKICGPKAANLGTLKALFPDRVADGFVIPFAVVKSLFESSGVQSLILQLNGLTGPEALKKLAEIRKAISEIQLPRELEDEILKKAKALIETNGGAGLFVRSDSNVEDLKTFTGAGLNRTVPNVIDSSKLINTIKLVWASPWEERAHLWRTKYVKNPEKILPSVLVMKSVDSHRSGVWVSKDLESGDLRDLFISANEGLGFKVVDGLESPEEKRLFHNNAEAPQPIEDRLELLNAVSAKTKFVLDNQKGGVKEVKTTLDEIIFPEQAEQLELISEKVKSTFGKDGVWESEFGVLENGFVVLFQVRPFNENMNEKKKELLRQLYSRYRIFF